ncbi:hypothetical protein [Rhizobium tubonense]|uniref:Uncharacterized protein n=1 Tax=Rhizobium tubonense TaxID=484088 RepID=A0A2W4C3L1_9HYPH|nr:hypothetical protein [Rhizobium tubonense]PZM08252.1 hypothetical protein CPY51_29435 [Rhizobium tubonense]
MTYQLEDDPIKYHQEAIRHHAREIQGMQFNRLRYWGAGPDERLHDVTARMLVVALASKKMHEGSLALCKASVG